MWYIWQCVGTESAGIIWPPNIDPDIIKYFVSPPDSQNISQNIGTSNQLKQVDENTGVDQTE